MILARHFKAGPILEKCSRRVATPEFDAHSIVATRREQVNDLIQALKRLAKFTRRYASQALCDRVYSSPSQSIDFRSEDKIAFCQAVNLMSPNCDFYSAPAEADIGMMSLLFR